MDLTAVVLSDFRFKLFLGCSPAGFPCAAKHLQKSPGFRNIRTSAISTNRKSRSFLSAPHHFGCPKPDPHRSEKPDLDKQFCGCGAFLAPGSGNRNRFFADPGSRISNPGSRIPNPYFESLVKIFWIKSSIIL
jgi:hypothetical protein